MFLMLVFDSIEPVFLQNPWDEYSTVSMTNVTYLIKVTANFVWFCSQADIKFLSKRVSLKPPIHQPLATYPSTGYYQLKPNRRPDSEHILLK